MDYTMLECDRCHFKQKVSDASNWVKLNNFPVPVGHYSRLEHFSCGDMDLCPSCHLSLRSWWRGISEGSEGKVPGSGSQLVPINAERKTRSLSDLG
jgi:hypothetical protein